MTGTNIKYATQEPYYKKSDGGGRLGYWNTPVAALEGEVAELEALVETARSARAVSPAAVAVADDALAAARWALRAVRLFADGGGGSGWSGGVSAARLKAAGGEEMMRAAGGGRWGLPTLAQVSTLLDTAVSRSSLRGFVEGIAHSRSVFILFFHVFCAVCRSCFRFCLRLAALPAAGAVAVTAAVAEHVLSL